MKIYCCGLVYSTQDPETYWCIETYNLKHPIDDIIGGKRVYKQVVYTLCCKVHGCTKLELHSYTKENGVLKLIFTQSIKMNFLQRIYMDTEGIQKRFKGEVPEGYKNPHLDNDKIFTKEEIDKMTWAETKKNQQAINYQKKVMGVPTKQQAEKAASKKGSGLVHVSGYTTSDGRKVADYYRALPRK